jgi:hypothetical protein
VLDRLFQNQNAYVLIDQRYLLKFQLLLHSPGFLTSRHLYLLTIRGDPELLSRLKHISLDQPDRLIEVEWDEHLEGYFVASVEIKALDRPGLLRDIGDVMSENQVNVIGVETSTNISDRVARMRFDFEISDPTHLNRLIYVIREIDSVYDIYRIVPGGDEQQILSGSDN